MMRARVATKYAYSALPWTVYGTKALYTSHLHPRHSIQPLRPTTRAHGTAGIYESTLITQTGSDTLRDTQSDKSAPRV